MISGDMEKLYPSAKTLVKEHIASRIFEQDGSVYDFSESAQQCAGDFMGWARLGSKPQCDVVQLMKFADEVIAEGIESVVLLGQGGSTQAPMTITKYNKPDNNRVLFKTLDSDSPVRMRAMFASCNPKNTLFIVSSKSGGTIEPRTQLRAIREHFSEALGPDFPKHLVAITDPGTELEKLAREEGWRAVFLGEPSVGGRFSALSVFGLLPAALVGIDLNDFLAHACEAERRCSEDAIDNPAVNLAAFLFDNFCQGRNKFSFLTPKRGRVLGLWIEQLVAESLGKGGQGILPNIEIDTLLLTEDPGDRSVIMYKTETDLWDESRNFEMSLAYIDPNIPRQNYRIKNVNELAEHFVMWEYAIAMCGYLMRVCPFDQPDVASTKAAVVKILDEGISDPDYVETFTSGLDMGLVEVRQSHNLKSRTHLRSTLYGLIDGILPGDYFALNAFLPFTGEGRREALECIRHDIAEAFGIVSCLEVGPRYLHSTGQLQKGGPDCGVFLILSADELKDIQLPADSQAPSLGSLAKAQAVGDALTLADRGRRVVHLHLPDNSAVTLRMLAAVIADVIGEVLVNRELEFAEDIDEFSDDALANAAEADVLA
ncbi:glucose-6-phosphate isomerase [Adlercreutzia sp. ZJ304]|uniref:glucose-6-phosphate isomerase n=1 Tax=Adlercreutzia sp. ZJ304 TaxID=2709791 RepID=UPI0013EC9F88|nr:glucose-6-phosphate isomerase [Adlercreutzia sp. ZJ304]